MLILPRYSLGIGDRFAHQGTPQLQAFVQLAATGRIVAPVWNKSYREHKTVGSHPDSLRHEADQAVLTLQWPHPYFVDADHVTRETVDAFLVSANFFTLDVAQYIGVVPSSDAMEVFLERFASYIGPLNLPHTSEPVMVTQETLRRIGATYLCAIQAAAELYRHIASHLQHAFVIEVSMDEVPQAQQPVDVFFILALLAEAGVPVQTLAPKFSGRFNKGVDYVGNVTAFRAELYAYLGALQLAQQQFGLPPSLKLSIHTGSDKFSIYPIFQEACAATGAGLHVKTAGTTWLEEAIGLAEAGGTGLALVKDLYARALSRAEELTAPYAQVIDVDAAQLPASEVSARWTSEQWVRALRHEATDPLYNPSLRQFMHVSYKLAAEAGTAYTDALQEHAGIIARNVTENLYLRHLVPLYGSTPLHLFNTVSAATQVTSL